MSDMLGGGFGVIVVLFSILLAILWFFLPFAIFGTKDKLNELIQESKRTNEHLAALRADVSAMQCKKDDTSA